MEAAGTMVRVGFQNILYLTDFSSPSEAALPFVLALAREFGSKIHAMNVVIPPGYVYTTPDMTAIAIEAVEERALAEMKRVEVKLAGFPHDIRVVRSTDVWDPVSAALEEKDIDLVVVGTHGRMGAERYLLGSVAEEILRQSPVPVLTIGPAARLHVQHSGHLNRILFATDFSAESAAAAPRAISLARGPNGHLVLLHVAQRSKAAAEGAKCDVSVAEAMHRLYEIPRHLAVEGSEAVIEYGDPAERIAEAASQRTADMIVIGVRRPAGVPGAATHLQRPTAHKLLVLAPCPVLTIRT